MKPLLIERFADNGGFSHYELIDSESGVILWSENDEHESLMICDFLIRKQIDDSIKIQHTSNDKSIRIAPKADNSCVIYTCG